ncbi:MAG: hypothetical protein WA821_13130 [Anaerolineales bacterium]
MKSIYKVSAILIVIFLLIGMTFPLFGAQAAMMKANAAKAVTIDGNSAGRLFDGIGMVNSSGTSKLLKDYPTAQRSDILNYLFKPNYGAGLTVMKNEIGGDINSSSGTEPSHQRLQIDTPVARGVNFWLAAQSKAVNASMRFAAGRWGMPSWAGASDSNMKDYYLSYLSVMAANGTPLNYLSPETNESSFDRNYVVNTLKPAMDAAGYSGVKLVAQDAYASWGIADTLVSDSALKSIISAINSHYITTSTTNATGLGIPLYNDESDTPMRERWARLMYVAVNIAKQYTDGKMVRVMYQPALDSVYDSIKYNGKGILVANTPWSGYYQVTPSLWMTAQFTQFAKPGWKFLDTACGSIDSNHYFITLRDPSTSDYSTIIVNHDDAAIDYTFTITGGLSTGAVHVWRTTQTEQFVKQADITPSGGVFTITIPGQSIYSLTTTTGQTKGAPANGIPADSALALPYSDDFASYTVGQQPKYTYDQAGAFEVASLNGGNVLAQTVTVAPIGWSGGPANPYTLIGDMRWLNYQVSADALLGSSGYVYVTGRSNLDDRDGGGPASGYQLQLTTGGAWTLNKIVFSTTTSLASGTLSGFSATAWHNLKVKMNGSAISALIDGMQVASVSDADIPSGQVALGGSFNTFYFDNLKVEAIDANTATSVVRVNDKDASITYDSSWYGEDENWMDYSRSTQKSNTVGGTMQFTFTGTGITLVGRKTSSNGTADIYMDGVKQATVDTSSSATLYRAPLYRQTGLASGTHTIKVVIVSNYFQLDVIEYTTSGGGGSATLTPTRTPTTGLTNTPTNTPTRTNTPGITNTPTRTPTAGLTNTPTRTFTPPAITLTPTRTVTSGPTNTPTITPTVGGACSPVTSTITAPFTQDGAGTFCWQSSNLGTYINSWNLTSLTVNGVNETNVYVAAGSLPAKINGYWYVSYNSAGSYGHFEAK